MLAESGAIARVAASQGGLLGEGRDFAKSEMLIGMGQDLWKILGPVAPTMMTVDKWDAEKAKAFQEAKPKIKEFCMKYPKFLVGDKARFTERGDTMGELDLWIKLYMMINGCYPEILTDVPELKNFYDRLSAMPGPKKYADNTTKFGALMNYFVPIP